jgi:hypothetical protein
MLDKPGGYNAVVYASSARRLVFSISLAAIAMATLVYAQSDDQRRWRPFSIPDTSFSVQVPGQMKLRHKKSQGGYDQYALVQDETAFIVFVKPAPWQGKPNLVMLKNAAGLAATRVGTPLDEPSIDKSMFAPAGTSTFLVKGEGVPEGATGSCYSFQDRRAVAVFIFIGKGTEDSMIKEVQFMASIHSTDYPAKSKQRKRRGRQR